MRLCFIFMTVVGLCWLQTCLVNPCCTPPKFNGVGRILIGSIHSGQGENTEVNFYMEFDRENKIMATNNNIKRGKHASSYKHIFDYRKGVQYLIVDHNECIKSTLPKQDQIGCIPADSNLTSNIYFGTLGSLSYSEHMLAKTYQVSGRGLTGSVTVTQTDCTLVSETMFGTVDRVPMMRSTVLVNQSNWVNPEFFNIPDFCMYKDELPLVAPWLKLSFMNW